MNEPLDKQSGCYECHSSMFKTTDAFDHEWHSTDKRANLNCYDCHTPGVEKTKDSAKDCKQCHNDLIPANSLIKINSYVAPSYVDAMHILCVDCHKLKAQELTDKKDLPLCKTCHESVLPDYLRVEIKDNLSGPYFNRVVLPKSDSSNIFKSEGL